MTQELLLQIINNTSDYLERTKEQYRNIHSYLVAIGINQTTYAKWVKLQESDCVNEEEYKLYQQAIDLIERTRDIIISNILTTQILNPYAKNSQAAMNYLKIVSKEFRPDEQVNTDKLNIVIKSGNGPISLKKGDK